VHPVYPTYELGLHRYVPRVIEINSVRSSRYVPSATFFSVKPSVQSSAAIPTNYQNLTSVCRTTYALSCPHKLAFSEKFFPPTQKRNCCPHKFQKSTWNFGWRSRHGRVGVTFTFQIRSCLCPFIIKKFIRKITNNSIIVSQFL